MLLLLKLNGKLRNLKISFRTPDLDIFKNMLKIVFCVSAKYYQLSTKWKYNCMYIEQFIKCVTISILVLSQNKFLLSYRTTCLIKKDK